MESNDYWTHIGLALAFFAAVVAPRLFSPGHTVNSVTYMVGSAVVVAAATIARHHTKTAASRTSVGRAAQEDTP